jgi:hypothetical protein
MTFTKPGNGGVDIPMFFVLSATYIVTLLVFKQNISDIAAQGAISIATTFAGAAAGAYMKNQPQQFAMPQNPIPPANPAQP